MSDVANAVYAVPSRDVMEKICSGNKISEVMHPNNVIHSGAARKDVDPQPDF
jgi:hypothetical protein